MPSQAQLQRLLTTSRVQRLHPATAAFQQLLAGEAKTGDGFRAELWFRRMVWSKCAPDAASYTSVIAAFARAGAPSHAEVWIRRMELRGVRVPVAACAGDREGKAGFEELLEFRSRLFEEALQCMCITVVKFGGDCSYQPPADIRVSFGIVSLMGVCFAMI
eukprot:s215_g13.t1